MTCALSQRPLTLSMEQILCVYQLHEGLGFFALLVRDLMLLAPKAGGTSRQMALSLSIDCFWGLCGSLVSSPFCSGTTWYLPLAPQENWWVRHHRISCVVGLSMLWKELAIHAASGWHSCGHAWEDPSSLLHELMPFILLLSNIYDRRCCLWPYEGSGVASAGCPSPLCLCSATCLFSSAESVCLPKCI